jgi:hypothetical protein
MRRERPVEPAGRVPDPVDGAAAPGGQKQPRRDAPEPGAAANFDHPHAEPHPARSSPLAPSVDAGGSPLARGPGDGDDRFAGLASPSPLAAELARSHDSEAPRTASRAADLTDGPRQSGAGSEDSPEEDNQDGDVPSTKSMTSL